MPICRTESDVLKKRLRVLTPLRLSNYQYFLHWFTDACSSRGIGSCAPKMMPWKLRQVVAKLCLSRNIFRGSPIIVSCAGYPDSFAFPYAYLHEIIPVLWDTWPRYHERLISSLRRNRVRMAFFTQRQVAQYVQSRLPAVRCIWLPEGINPDGYKPGRCLSERRVDLLELGRLMPRFHEAVKSVGCTQLYKDPKDGLLFPDFASLQQGLSNARVTVCFPRCDTHPEMAGNIETLTQRYWECMLSRTLILGRAPRELVDFIGYNPVIEVDWRDPAKQVKRILANIGEYQELVDRNHKTAQHLSPWSARMDMVLAELQRGLSS